MANAFFCFALLLGSAAGNANSGRKQAVINVGGASDMQSGLLRSARPDADVDAELKKLMADDSASKAADTSNSLIAKGSSSSDDEDLTNSLRNLDSMDKATANSKASDDDSGSNADLQKLMGSLDQTSDSAAESTPPLDPKPNEQGNPDSENDPELNKDLAGIDQELKVESMDDSAKSSTKTADGNLKFQALDKLMGDLKNEQDENGELDKSLKTLGGNQADETKDDKKMDSDLAGLDDSKDLEKSLADLDQMDNKPNAASLLQMEVDDDTNRRMSEHMHRMGKMGAHIKHLENQIERLQRMHDASQNGVSLLELAGDDFKTVKADAIKDLQKRLAKDKKLTEQKIQHVQKTWTDVAGSVALASTAPQVASLTQKEQLQDLIKSDEEKLSKISNRVATTHNGWRPDVIDAAADDKMMQQLLASYEAKYGNPSA